MSSSNAIDEDDQPSLGTNVSVNNLDKSAADGSVLISDGDSCCCSCCFTRKAFSIMSGVLGIIFVALGLTIFLVFPTFFHSVLSSQLPLRTGGATFSTWESPPVPISMQFYLFNLTNEKEFLSGSKPVVNQIGPFTYSEHRQKVNVTINSNSTISYKELKYFNFDRSRSCKICDENANITTVNLAYFGVAYQLRFHSVLSRIAAIAFEADKNEAILHKTAKQIIWGYEDPTLKIISKLAELVKFKLSPIVGLFAGKNGTDDGVYNIFSGENDINKLTLIDRWQGSTDLSYWSTASANMINGTDGTEFPPFVSESNRLYLFSSDICRSIYLTYSQPSSVLGIDLLQFTAPADVFKNSTLNPDNLGFCTDGVCLDSGVLNMSVCQQGMPAISSQPHFYQAAQKYIDSVIGLNPSEDCATELHVEPNTGVVMKAAKKLQVNLAIDSYKHFSQTGKLSGMFMPLLWINESAIIDQNSADEFKGQVLSAIFIAKLLQWILIGIGVGLLVLCLIILVNQLVRHNDRYRRMV